MKKSVAALATVGGVLALWVGWGLYVILATERPPYRVVQQLGSDVELRRYEEQTWISTDYAGDDAAFSTLASYIFGGNRDGRQIAMTAPVITDEKMAFVLPTGVTRADAPTPEDQDITIKTVPPRSVAALHFSWWTSRERVLRKTAELLGTLRANGVEPIGDPFLMRYNDPWTPPFLRRNEVAVEVK